MGSDDLSRPRRRRFSAEYKLAILAEYDALTEEGAKGALLRARACTARTSPGGAAPATPAP